MRVASAFAVLLAMSAVLAVLASPAAAEPQAPGAPAAGLETVSWLAGSWVGALGDEPVEETWFPPADGTMVGLFRWLKGGEVYLYELLSFEETEDGLVLKVKHFRPGLVGLEEKAESKLFDLVGVEDVKAVFAERGDEVEHSKVTYRPEGDAAMIATFEEERDGKPVVLTFRYERK